MSITAKIGAVLMIVFAVLLGGAWLILDNTVRPSFERQEIETHMLDRARVEANLEAVAADLHTRALDYAAWDDTYRYISGVNPGYIAANFARDEWLAEYNIDLAIYFNEGGRTLWSRQWSADGPTEAMVVIRARILNAIREAHNPGQVRGALWTESMGPILYVAVPSTRTDGRGDPRGYVVFGRRIDTGALGEQTQLALEFVRRRPVASSPQFHIDEYPDHLRSMIPLRAPNGDLVGGVIAQSERKLKALGAQAVTTALLAAALMFGAAMCALWLVLRRVVIARIERIKLHFEAQKAEVAPLPADKNGDEIASLTDAYNELTRRLNEADDRARDALLEREAAAAANRMKSDFLANISHELRTPLNDVIGYADLIDEELSDRGEVTARDDLQRITGAARNMLAMVTELLDLSRIEGDRLELVPESFEVDETLLSAAAALRACVKTHNVDLRVLSGASLGQAITDQNRLRQCIVNVLTHAVRRSPGKMLTLRAARLLGPNGDQLRFEVLDGGRPLSSAQLEGLFEPFLREDDERLSGARLGLAVTRKLAILMGGSFNVTSSNARGCTYVLIVPAMLATDAAPLAKAS